MADTKLGPNHYSSVFYLAGEFARHLQRQAQEDFPSQLQSGTFTLFTDGEVICAQIAGLCHDLGVLHFALPRFQALILYSYASHC